MNCSICQNPFNEQNKKPLKFPCGHIYCFKCVYKMRKSKNVHCPQDDTTYDLTQEFPVDNSIFDQQKQEKEEKIKAETLGIIDEQIQKITDSFDHNFKIITVGSAFTGKTSILQKYFKNLFGQTTPTISVDFFTKILKVKDNNVMITAYDTAGSESYKSMTEKYVRDKHCILLVYDITQRKTFEDLENWKNWTDELKRQDAFYVLVGTKNDLEQQREVTKQEGLDWAKSQGISYFEVSSKADTHIKDLFEFCVKKCYKDFAQEEQTFQRQSVTFKVRKVKQKQRGCFDWFKSIFGQLN